MRVSNSGHTKKAGRFRSYEGHKVLRIHVTSEDDRQVKTEKDKKWKRLVEIEKA